MNKWLWSIEKLKKICSFKKPDPEILTWAVNRLCRLYPEQAGEVVIKFIDSDNNDLVDEVIDFFKEHSEPRFLEQMRQIYKQRSGISLEVAAAVLAEAGDPRFIELFTAKYGHDYKHDTLGYALSLVHLSTLKTDEEKVKEIVSKALEDLKQDIPENSPEVKDAVFTANMNTGAGILELLEFCGQNPHLHSFFIDLLIIIGDCCDQSLGEPELEKPAVEEGEQSKDRVEIPFLLEEMFLDLEGGEEKKTAKSWKEMRKLFEKAEYGKAVDVLSRLVDSMLEERKEIHGEDNFSKWSRRKGTPRRHIEALSAFRRFIPTAPAPVKMSIAAAAVYIGADLMDMGLLIGHPVNEMTADDALDFFLIDRPDVDEDEAAIKVLESTGQEEQEKIIDTLLNHLFELPASFANERVVRYLCDTGEPRVIEQLLKMAGLSKDGWEHISRALLKLETSTLKLIAPILTDENIRDSRIKYALSILGDIPTDETVNVLLQNWDRLFTIGKKSLLTALWLLGDRRFIKPLKNECREDEYIEGKTFCFLCRLNGVRDPMLKKIDQDTRQWEKEMKRKLDAVASDDYRFFFREPLIAGLTCRRCGRLYHYRLEDIVLMPEMRDIVIRDAVVCKHCGALDHYKYGRELWADLTTVFLMIAKVKDLEPEDLEDSTFEFCDVRMIDGKKMSANDTVAYYSKKLDQDPENPEYLIGLANSLRTAKMSEDAEPFYREALHFDPEAVDVYVNLGQMAHGRGNLREAYDYYWEVYRLMDTGNYYRFYMDKDDFKEEFFESFVDVAIALEKPVPDEVFEWMEEIEEE